MQYGKQTVPISSEEDNHLKYLPEKDMQAIGFVSLHQIPRHMYMKVLSCLPASFLFVPQLQPIQTAKTGNQIQHEWPHCTPILAAVCLSTRCGGDQYDNVHVGIFCASTLKCCCCQCVQCVSNVLCAHKFVLIRLFLLLQRAIMLNLSILVLLLSCTFCCTSQRLPSLCSIHANPV